MKAFFTFFLFVCTFVYSQSNNIIKIEYKETENQGGSESRINEGVLFIHRNLSYYSSKYSGIEGSNAQRTDIINLGSSNKKNKHEIFINTSTGMLIDNLYESRFLKKYYSVSEKIPQMEWKLLAGEKKV